MTQMKNPFRPGAGQVPVFLAGRTKETDEFKKVLGQQPVLKNLIISGLRGVGKTVLLESFKPLASREKWLWVSNDMSESASISEEKIATRIIADLSVRVSPLISKSTFVTPPGFTRQHEIRNTAINFEDLWLIYQGTPGLTSDKLKAVIQNVRLALKGSDVSGIIFAYDEAQNMSDNAEQNQFPLSLILDVFSALQRDLENIPIILVLTGLPTLFPRLNEARTYTERMFDVIMLGSLSKGHSKAAIKKPIEISKSELTFADETVDDIVNMAGGYPYFLQYICKEVYDAWIGKIENSQQPSVPRAAILNKLDQDFFAPRWDRATYRQQEFLSVIAHLDSCDAEFTAQEIAEKSKEKLEKGFSNSHAVQILKALIDKGLIYRTNKHGKYTFAVPLMGEFIKRQSS